MGITHFSDIRLTGSCWDDLKAPAAALYSPGNSGSGPDRDTNDGTLLFDSSSDEELFIQFQFPHHWKEGSIISPHLHWSKTTSASGTVKWMMQYKWANIGAVFGDFSTATAATEAVTNDDTANLHALAAFDDIDGTGKTISSMLIVRLYRDVSEDNYAADAKLYEFDIHYQIDGLGSDGEYTKRVVN